MRLLALLKNTALSLALTLIGVVVALVVIEVGLRGVQYLKRPEVTWSDRPKFYVGHEGSSTLQDYPHDPVKAANTFRIAVVGDSFTFAPFMQFTDAFPKKLEQLLNMNSVPTKVEVINYGVPAYSTSHEVKTVEKAIQEQADLIILQITLNDPEIKGHTPIGITDFSRFAAPVYGPQMQWLLRHWRTLDFVLKRWHASKTHREYEAYFKELYTNPRNVKMFEESMTAIRDRAREGKVPLVAVVFPLFGLPLDERYPFTAIHQQVAALLSSLEIPHRDISSLFKDIPLERLQVIPGVDRHPNEIAHRMAAEELYEWLVSFPSLLPAEVQIKNRYRRRIQIINEQRL